VPKAGPGKTLCGAQLPNKPKGTTCHNVAGFRTDHIGVGRCYRHGGRTESHQRGAETALARIECEKLGVPIEVDPGEALMRELWETAGNVAFYRALVQALPAHPELDVYEHDEDGGHWERGQPGVYGRTYHVSGVPTGEGKPHVLVTLYNDERAHLTAVATAALKAGVEERRVRMAESDATQIFEAQVAALRAIGREDQLDEFRRAFAAALRGGFVQPVALGAR
jgi:hypothetical protein